MPDDLWPALDALVAGPVVVLTTIRFHGRTRDAVLERYGGEKVRFDAPMPEGVEAFVVEGSGRRCTGCRSRARSCRVTCLIGDGEGGIRMCPESWLRGYLPEEGARIAELRAALRPLLELPVEHVLASHWSPVIGGGHAALERALA